MDNNSLRPSRTLGGSIVACLAIGMVFTSSRSTNMAQAQAKDGEKRFVMAFDKAPWRTVFEWYSEHTGLAWVSRFPPPAGTFSHSTPKGQKYTLHEVAVVINESLMKENYALIPLRRSTTMVKIAK